MAHEGKVDGGDERVEGDSVHQATVVACTRFERLRWPGSRVLVAQVVFLAHRII